MDDVVGHVVVATGNENLGAGDAVGAVFLFHGPGLHQLQVGAAMRLRQAHGAGPFAGNHFLRHMLAHPWLARRPECGIGRRRQARIHREGLVRRHAHFGDRESHDRRQRRAARFLRRAEAVPAIGAEFLEGLFKSGRRAHDAVFEHATMLVAHLVQRLQNLLAKLRPAFEDRARHVGRQVPEARHIGPLVDAKQLVKQKQEIFHRGLVTRHRGLLAFRIVSRRGGIWPSLIHLSSMTRGEAACMHTHLHTRRKRARIC